MAPTADSYPHLRAAGTSVVLDCSTAALPRVLHWGRDLGDLDAAALATLAGALVPPAVTNTMDDPVPLGLLPEASAGWAGTPGLTAHRDGGDFSTSFEVGAVERAQRADGADVVRVEALDRQAGVALVIEIELLDTGLLRQRATVTNAAGGVLDVQGLLVALPVPPPAQELLDFTGRHLRERSPQRHSFTLGTHLRENRRGRTSTDGSPLLVAGEAGFGFAHGQVWALHVAWSGNQRLIAESMPSGARLLGAGETLLPGEVRLAEGESYSSPWVYAAHAEGLDALAARFHAHLRALPVHPERSRPVTLNTWEAVYFDHDLTRLRTLADLAAQVGVERFVLDDGWFRGRNHDRAGLGDWEVDPEVWPEGLHPLVEHVVGHGMEFGLWVEPEMVNPDSDLARAHPDWILRAGSRLPPLSRHQQVLDLARPEVFDHLLERLDALLTEYPIAYLKWDHNRDLVDAGTVAGQAGVHAHTLAVYRLMDELRRRHPALEIESCSSGGGRVDLGVLERTERVWASDCVDPLERQQIQRWTGQLLPPELIGSHVGSPVSHTTGRQQTLDFRALAAFFGHFGIEWDLTTADAEDLARLREWVTTHQRLRPLLHHGRVVRGDHPDPGLWVHGVVSHDGSHAVHALVQTETSVQSPPGPVRLPGLLADASYVVRPLPPGDRVAGPGIGPLAWWSPEGVTLPGRVLVEVGLQAPVLFPEAGVLLETHRVD